MTPMHYDKIHTIQLDASLANASSIHKYGIRVNTMPKIQPSIPSSKPNNHKLNDVNLTAPGNTRKMTENNA